MNDFYLATGIYVLAYAAIVLERIHKTVVALAGAVLVLLFHVVNQHDAFHSETYGVDYNVIFLLIGMMLIINISKETGIFEWLAIKSSVLVRSCAARSTAPVCCKASMKK